MTNNKQESTSSEPSINFIDVLAEARTMENYQQYLEDNYSQHPKLIASISQILSLRPKDSHFFMSTVVQSLAKDAAIDFDPSHYLKQTFGNWQATEILTTTKKSTILKAAPINKDYFQEVAIKIISPDYQVLAGVENITMQAHYLAKLSHPNLVEIKEANVNHEGTPYIVMEYLPGPNIIDYAQTQKLSLAARLTLFNNVCACLAHIHKQKVIHADLKPDNILLDNHGIVKVIDLDLSFTTDSNFHDNYNFRNISGYTKQYASPEQLIAPREITTQTDIYSLGCILAELLTAHTPEKLSDQEIITQLTQCYGANERYIELLSVIRKASAHSLTDRYESAQALSEDISSYLTKNKIVSAYQQQATLLYKVKHKARRNPVLSGSLVLTGLAITFAAATLVYDSVHTQQLKKVLIESEDPKKRHANSKSNKKQLFEQEAQQVYQAASLLQTDHSYYQELMTFGQAYLSQGAMPKARLFFNKAKNLYPEKNSIEAIEATTKLAQSYDDDDMIDEANKLLDPYHKWLFQQAFSSTSAIEMFITLAQINSSEIKSDDISYTSEQVYKILDDIDLSLYNNEQAKQHTKIKILFIQATILYYSLPYDAEMQIRPKTTVQAWQTDIQPKLELSKSKLTQAISLIKQYDIQTHLEAQVYIWLARVDAELGNYAAADHYSELGINKVINIFGLQHPQTIKAYIKRYTAFRYNNNTKAHAAIYQAYLINKLKNNSGNSNSEKNNTNLRNDSDDYLVYEYLIKSFHALGNLSGAETILNELYQLHQQKKSQFSWDINSLTNSISFITRFKFFALSDDIKHHLRLLIQYEAEYMKIEPNYTLMPIIVLNKILLSPLPNTEKQRLMQQAENFILAHSGENKLNALSMEYIPLLAQLTEYCALLTHCDLEQYERHYAENIYWSDYEQQYSIEKLTTELRLAQAFLRTKQLKKAQQYITSAETFIRQSHIDNIPESSVFRAILLYLQSKYHFLNHDSVLLNQYKPLALVKIGRLFPPQSQISIELNSFILPQH